ncbi:glycosyltransferase family 4 protein [Acidilobus sp.]|uniref:glycosyltransferase family 4 protein n=1 Tax=Acidilobus sp. TaxID=1872109 RepID=UPI003D05DB49
MHVSPFYSPVVGGVEEVVKRVAEYMASRGHEVHVITYNRLRSGELGSLPREETINGVHVIRLRPRLIWSHGSYSPELPDVIRSLRPDVVHVHVWRHPHAFQVARLKEELGFRAILHGHSPFYGLARLGVVTWTYHKLVDVLGRGYLRGYDVYIALTRWEARRISSLGLGQSKIIVVPNGVDEDHCNLSLERAEGQVLYLGRVSREKNLWMLVKSMEFVKREARRASLVMAGPDEGLARDLLEYSRRHGLDVRYVGRVSDEAKHSLFLRSEVYALPSKYEGFALTLLEAAIHTTPSVITGEGSQLEAAPPGVASLWAEPRPDRYAEAIARLLTDDALRRSLGESARRWAEEHTWSRILPAYDDIYRGPAFNGIAQ